MFRALALFLIPVVKGDLVRGANEDGSEGEGIVEGWAGGDAKDIAVWFVC